MFRRTAKEEAPATTVVDKGPGSKGRPTPTRREAEAATKARARAVVDKKEARRQARDKRATQTAKMREGMRSGDERYLPPRDKGPVKRFTRDFIDSRLCIAELLLPLLLAIMVMQYSGSDALVRFSTTLWSVVLALVLVDTIWTIVRLKRALRAQFPDEDLKGVTSYAVLRVIQLRWLRMPKPQVGLGGKPKR